MIIIQNKITHNIPGKGKWHQTEIEREKKKNISSQMVYNSNKKKIHYGGTK